MAYPVYVGKLPPRAMSVREAASYVAETPIVIVDPISLEARRAFTSPVRSPIGSRSANRALYSVASEIGWYGHLWDLLVADGYVVDRGVDAMGTCLYVYAKGSTREQIRSGDARSVTVWNPDNDAAGENEWSLCHYPVGSGWDPEYGPDGRIATPHTFARATQPWVIAKWVKKILNAKATPNTHRAGIAKAFPEHMGPGGARPTN